MTEYTAITVWQPWATLIAYEVKPYEFRGWAAPVRLHGQRIAIHASARKPVVAEIRALLVKLHSPRWRETGMVRSKAVELLERLKDEHASLPLRSVVCTALMGPSLSADDVAKRLGLVNDSDRMEHANWAWPLSQVERLEPPVPARAARLVEGQDQRGGARTWVRPRSGRTAIPSYGSRMRVASPGYIIACVTGFRSG